MTNYLSGSSATLTANSKLYAKYNMRFYPGDSITRSNGLTLYAYWITAPPAMTWKIWSGGEAERFTFQDMQRIQSNISTLMDHLGFSSPLFSTPARDTQFRYDDAQKVESSIVSLAEYLHLQIDAMDVQWGPIRSLSFVDFERWEFQGWKVYNAMGGTEERISP